MIGRNAVVGIAMALVAGCSGGGSPPPPGTALRGTYQAAAAGPYAQMTFLDGEHFSLLKSSCTRDCMEVGTYALNAAGTVLALRDAVNGKITELPFSALQSAPAAPSATSPGLLDQPLRPLGTPLTTPGGSLGGDGGSLTSGSGPGGLSVGSGGMLTFDGGSLTSDGGSALPGFNAGSQPFALGDSGASDAGGSPFTSSASDAGSTIPDGGIYPCIDNGCPHGGSCSNGWCFIPGVSCKGPMCL